MNTLVPTFIGQEGMHREMMLGKRTHHIAIWSIVTEMSWFIVCLIAVFGCEPKDARTDLGCLWKPPKLLTMSHGTEENINCVLYDYNRAKTKENKSESRPNHIVDVLK
jgi:hypothetical protein